MGTKCSALFWLLLSVPLFIAAQPHPTLPELIHEASEHFSDIESANLDGLLKRIGDSRLVLLGEATHGTAEFYDMRARISKELIEKKGFNMSKQAGSLASHAKRKTIKTSDIELAHIKCALTGRSRRSRPNQIEQGR